MAIVFHEADDSCAPFPHRVVSTPARIVVVNEKKTITFPEHNYIICAQCDHWILSVALCDCPQRCHELGRMLVDLAQTG